MTTKLTPIDYEKLAGACKTFGEVDHVERLQRVARLLAEGADPKAMTPREADYAGVLTKAGKVVADDDTGAPCFVVEKAPKATAKTAPAAAPAKPAATVTASTKAK